MENKKSSESRRKLLKSIAAGSGAIVAGKSLPDSWTKPVVDTVMLPAHALTSGCVATSITATSTFDDGLGRAVAIWDSTFVNINNDGESSPGTITISATSLPAGTYFVSMAIEDPGGSTTLTVTTECSSITVTQTISGGEEDGSGTGMVQVTLPEGTLQEISIIPFPPPP